METATQTIVETIQLHGVVTGSQQVTGTARITGQYLYDLFFNDNADRTKMDIVRNAVASVEVSTFKDALKDMVGIAAKHSDAYKKTAQNHQSVMRIAYGAWRFAKDQLAELGADDKTGYQAMRVLGKQALDKAGLKWDGTKAAEKVDKAVAALDAAQGMRLAELRRDNPKGEKEEPLAYEQRIRAMLAEEMAQENGVNEIVSRHSQSVLIEQIRTLCGDDDKLALIVGELAGYLVGKGYDINVG